MPCYKVKVNEVFFGTQELKLETRSILFLQLLFKYQVLLGSVYIYFKNKVVFLNIFI